MLRLLAAGSIAAAFGSAASGSAGSARLAAMQQLKEELHTLPPEEATARLAALAQTAGPPPPRQKNIDNFIVLFMVPRCLPLHPPSLRSDSSCRVRAQENQATDVFAGCMDRPGLDSIRNATIPKDPTNPSGGSYTFKCQKEYICSEGPAYKPEAEADGTDDVIDAFGPEQIPVKVNVAEEFAYFNRLYSAVPAASSPNHLFAQTATSCGIVSNIPYEECGGNQEFFPPLSIYDSMTLHNVSFGIYYNTTCETAKDHGSCYGPKSPEPTRGGVVSQYYGPDVNIDGVWRYRDKFESHERFYDQVAAGTLPQFSWISPSEQASDHPCNDIRKGERQLKDIYEAVRAGPKWDKTLMLVVYDDYGGAYDHVIPPAEWRTIDHMGKPREGKAVPADDAPCHVRDQCDSGPYWNFTSLGLRVTSMLISPWVEKGRVVQEPTGPTNTSQFELSSIPATIHSLFNLSMFLTKRDEWAGTFDSLMLDEPRPAADCPMHLPDPPKPAHPWTPPPPMKGEEADDGGAAAEPTAQHCGREDGVCRGAERETVSQRRRMEWLALRTGVDAPAEELSHEAAHAWLSERWEHGLRSGAVAEAEGV